MPKISFDEQIYHLKDGQSVLSGLLEEGVQVPHVCGVGTCQSCLMYALEGKPGECAQRGLRDTQKAQNAFLACLCQPTEDLVVALPRQFQERTPCQVQSKDALNGAIYEVKLKPLAPFSYRAGQYITLWKDSFHGRSYSLASVPELEGELSLHIRHYAGGLVSTWVANELQVGDEVFIQGPYGDCFYLSEKPEQPMLLVGTSTGVAPLYGVARDALNKGHHGDIHLFHGALNEALLHCVSELTHLDDAYENFHYHPSVLQAEQVSDKRISIGAIDNLSLSVSSDLKGYKAYLCGSPDVIRKLKKRVFLQGASLKDIYCDPFVPFQG